MAACPNLSEFYQDYPVEIGENDLHCLKSNELMADFNDCTHWVIALEGNEIYENTIHWKVIVFPSNGNGYFNYSLPYFTSPLIHSFHDAFALSMNLKKMAKLDQLSTNL